MSPAAQIARDGFAFVQNAISAREVHEAILALEQLQATGAALSHGGSAYAARDLLRNAPSLCTIANSPAVTGLAQAVLGPDAFIARALYFNKTPDANWTVPWHQDVTIAVRERIETPGYGPWSVKSGRHHVRPPVEVLERMLAIRIHLDDCGPESGPLMVLPGTHAAGILSDAQHDQLQREVKPVTCTVRAGDLIAMRPLLMHASDKATSPLARRVIHLEFATGSLAPGLEWAGAVDHPAIA